VCLTMFVPLTQCICLSQCMILLLSVHVCLIVCVSLTMFVSLSQCVFKLNRVPDITFELRISGKCGEFRKAIDEIYSSVQNATKKADVEKLVESLSARIAHANVLAHKEFDMADDTAGTFRAKLQYLIPDGGFVHNNVQRMLLSSSNLNHLDNVPMAIFVEHAKSDVA